MQTLRKLSSKKGKFDGLQLGEVVSKSRQDNHSVTQVVTHTEPKVNKEYTKETVSKKAEQVAHAIQKRHDTIRKLPPKEVETPSPIISVRLVKNETKNEKRPSPIKPKLVSPKPSIWKNNDSHETKKISPIKPKLISPEESKRKRVSFKKDTESPIKKQKLINSPILKSKGSSPTPSPTLKKPISPIKNKIEDKEYIVKYRPVEIRTLISNYEYPTSYKITDKRMKIIMKYISHYERLNNRYDSLILASLTQGIILC